MRWFIGFLLVLGALVVTGDADAGQGRVRGSINRRTGSYTQPHVRTSPNRTKIDNWSTKGNVNPYTGKKGSRNPW